MCVAAYQGEPHAGDRVHGEPFQYPNVAVPAANQDNVPQYRLIGRLHQLSFLASALNWLYPLTFAKVLRIS